MKQMTKRAFRPVIQRIYCMRAAAPRLAFIDALKAIASQLIVLHHLAFYGPMSDIANDLAPALIAWLSQDARIAVQVFLVIGGFLAAKGLAPDGRLTATRPLALLQSRYLKLATPYLAALLLSIGCAAIAGQLMTHDSIPGAPSTLQFIAHALLLQNLLNFDSLSAGVWYIAIDFQLFALLLSVLWLARSLGSRINGSRIMGVLLVAGLAAASLFHFNRSSAWDDWALYFFGSYALGVLAYWASERKQAPGWLAIIAMAAVAALLVDYRSRIAVALLVALALAIARCSGGMEKYPRGRILAYLGQISYSVFLLNFPIALVINAVFSYLAPENTLVNALGMLIAWAACIGAGALFYHAVECRARQWQTLAKKLTLDPLLALGERLAFIVRFVFRSRLKPKP